MGVITKALADTISMVDWTDLFKEATVYNFIAKNKSFNFDATTKVFHYDTKTKTFSFTSKP